MIDCPKSNVITLADTSSSKHKQEGIAGNIRLFDTALLISNTHWPFTRIHQRCLTPPYRDIRDEYKSVGISLALAHARRAGIWRGFIEILAKHAWSRYQSRERTMFTGSEGMLYVLRWKHVWHLHMRGVLAYGVTVETRMANANVKENILPCQRSNIKADV